MSAFVLIHGSGQNAAGWSRVAGLLKGRGHSVAAPELPKAEPTRGLRDYAAFAAESIVDPLGVESLSIDAGHCPFISRAEELTDMLEKLAH